MQDEICEECNLVKVICMMAVLAVLVIVVTKLPVQTEDLLKTGSIKV